MKKIAILILTFLYLLPAVGFSVNVHWCGNRAQTVELGFAQNKKCSCGEKMVKGCCKNTHTVIKLTANHHAASSIISPTNIVYHAIPVPFFYQGIFFEKVASFHVATDASPPGKNKLPVYLTTCTFRI
jgi:hypothetical protein